MGEVLSFKITKSNDLVEASYKLTLNEQRLILMAIGNLDSRKPMPHGKLTIKALDFAETFYLDPKFAYQALDEAASRLYERDIRTYDGRHRERFRWVYSVRYHDGEGQVTLGFSPEITPYLTLLHQRFTTYDIRQISQLGSPYSIRLYELLKRFAETGERAITLPQFKERLQLDDQYPRFYDLKRRIITPAVAEINAHTDLQVKWQTMRKGRAVAGLLFLFERLAQQKLPF